MPRWASSVGGGPALALVDVTDGVGEAQGVQAKLAGNLIAGVVWSRVPSGKRRFCLEGRAVFGDTSDFELTVGLYF